MSQLRVFWDLDGVVYPFIPAVARWFHISKGIPLEQMPPEPGQWNTWEVWGMEQAEWWAGVDEGVQAGYIFANGEPEPGAVEASRTLRAAGHTQHIVTARGTDGAAGRATATQMNTRRWLLETGFVYDTLDFSHDKTIRAVDVAIEDNLGNYDKLSAAGVPTVLIDRRWNQDDGSRNRIFDLQQFVDFVGVVEGLVERGLLDAALVPA